MGKLLDHWRWWRREEGGGGEWRSGREGWRVVEEEGCWWRRKGRRRRGKEREVPTLSYSELQIEPELLSISGIVVTQLGS